MKSAVLNVLLTCVVLSACSQPKVSNDRQVGDGCEDCELMFAGMPSTIISWKTKLAADNEPGEPLIIRGTIFKNDGKTPASDVILYVYQTDNTGRYTPAPNQVHAKRHGHLRGWVKTDAQGKYEFSTVRPAAYPNRNDPQHIHPIIKEPGRSFYWIDDFVFDDDPLLTVQVRSGQMNRGGSGIIKLKKNEKEVWIGKRDIILGLNIPNY